MTLPRATKVLVIGYVWPEPRGRWAHDANSRDLVAARLGHYVQ